MAHEVRRAVADMAEGLRDAAGGARRLVLLAMRNDIPSVLGYLAALEAGLPIALIHTSPKVEHLEDLIARYRPAVLLGDTGDHSNYGPVKRLALSLDQNLAIEIRTRLDDMGAVAHDALAVLLSTSGSTGSPRFVRLSRSAVVANAEQIASALTIDARECAPTTLPLHYSFGLSVLNSHLVAGARILVTNAPILSEELWAQIRTFGCTSFAGVPYSYEVLRRLDLEALAGPSLQTMTQAGGRLTPAKIQEFHDRMVRRGGQFIVMYGQTEATARIAVLPSALIPAKLGSCGRALPGGSLTIEDEAGHEVPAGTEGEVIFRGPNVMMGYAESADDLMRGDEVGGRLATGDLGFLDHDGYLFVTGRRKRIAKVLGFRISLDEVETLLAPHGRVAVIGRDERIVVFCEGWTAAMRLDQRASLARAIGLHPTTIEFREVENLPLLLTGKIDYQRLERL